MNMKAVKRTLLPLITTSERRSFRSCQRKHNHRYVALREPIHESKPAAYFGNLGHCGMEYFYRGMMAGDSDPTDRALSEMRKYWQESKNPCEYVWASASTLITGYCVLYADEQIEVLAVESKFRTPLINPDTGARSRSFDLGGMIDVVVRCLKTGEILLMEHKTTSLDISPGSDYWQRLRVDDQVSAYFDGARSLGFDVVGCLYDVLQRPGQKPAKATPAELRKYKLPKVCPLHKDEARAEAKAHGEKVLVKDIAIVEGCNDCEPTSLYANQREFDETPSEYGERIGNAIIENPQAYYQRGMVRRLDKELQEARWNTWTIAGQMREASRTGRHVPNYSSCTAFNSTCGYFPVCTGDADLWDDHRFQDRPAKHSELA